MMTKLDRLARNVEFTARILNSGIEFIAVDNPHANKLTIHILAAMAEHEREQISGNCARYNPTDSERGFAVFAYLV